MTHNQRDCLIPCGAHGTLGYHSILKDGKTREYYVSAADNTKQVLLRLSPDRQMLEHFARTILADLGHMDYE